MSTLILLGAGASVEAGVPDSYEMTKRMLKAFEKRIALTRPKKYSRIIRFVTGGLLFQKGVKGYDPFDGINIEELFNVIGLLAEREESDISPFISSWHPMLDELDKSDISESYVQELLKSIYKPIQIAINQPNEDKLQNISELGERLDKAITSRIMAAHVLGGGSGIIEIENLLRNIINQAINSSRGELFQITKEIMIRLLIDFVWVKDKANVNYLLDLVKFSKFTEAYIATLNYDNTIELAGQVISIPIDTGFDAWSKTGEFKFKQDHVPLIKLHGSIDWALSHSEGSDEKPIAFEEINQVPPETMSSIDFHPAVIFGERNKLTAKGPFLSLFRAFELKLKGSENLIVIGYSFRDDHINTIIGNWINESAKHTITVVDPKFPYAETELMTTPYFNLETSNEFVKELLRLKNRLNIINSKASEGIIKIIQTTKTDKH